MKPTRLHSLRVDKFRGASTPLVVTFDVSKPIALVFGENGSGKSTIVDAIDAVMNESAAAFEGISGAKAGKHFPSLKSKPKDVRLQAKFTNGTEATATMSGDHITTTTVGTGNSPRATVLRRSRILTLLIAKPADRYKAFEGFIDVSHVQDSEDELADAIKAVETESKGKALEAANAESALERLHAEHATPEERALEPLAWAKSYEGRDVVSLRKEHDEIATGQKLLRNLAEADENTNAAQEKLEGVRRTAKAAKEALAKAAKDTPGGVELLLEILRATQGYLERQPTLATCPACGQSVDAAALSQHLAAELKKLPEVEEAVAADRDAAQALKAQTAETKSRYERLVSDGRALLTAFRVTGSIIGSNVALPDDSAELDKESDDLRREAIAAAKALFVTARSAEATWAKERDARSVRITLLQTIQSNFKSAVIAREQGARLERIKGRLTRIRDVMRTLRIEFVQRELKSVEAECDRLYSRIHPGESIGQVRLAVDPDKKASCEVEAVFGGERGVPPQAYYSESHLDTLGFCLFLAMAKRDSSADMILVLDDIFTSVDEQHLRRIADLLVEESGRFAQIILTTHMGKWRTWFQASLIPVNVFSFLPLASEWKLAKGIQTREELPTKLEELRAEVAAEFPDRDRITNVAGKLLERVLAFPTSYARASAPIKRDGKYDLSDYICAWRSAVNKGWRVVEKPRAGTLLAEPTFREAYDLKAGAEALNEARLIRNLIGDHANDDGDAFTDSEVKSCAKKVIELVDYLTCHEEGCGSLVATNREIAGACSCGRLRLEKRTPE